MGIRRQFHSFVGWNNEVPECLIHVNQLLMKDEGRRKNKVINYSSAEASSHCFEPGDSVISHRN